MRSVGAVALASLLLLITFGCSRRSGEDLAFLGDSITDQARAEIIDRFHVPADRLKAAGGKTVQDMAIPTTELVAAKPGRVVINLGTNDVLGLLPVDSTAAQLEGMASRFPEARCVFLVTINERMISPQGGDPHGLAVALNDRIRSFANGHRNWRIIDWAGTVNQYDAAGDPNGPVTNDTVHPTAVGRTMLLDDYERAINSC